MKFQPGQSGNPGFKVIHGFYKRRVRHCDACGTEYVAHRLTSRFCSDDCRTNFGAWSYPVAHQINKRVLGTTRG